uniref:Uncharacterized protein n=1 Tax=Physcomitrium patens TaxID=3218 RepID=A0A2K1IMX2_PHYPA|nr:hypothetical protein PHYPA_026948 [Physcomitrium patens]
MHLQLPLDQHTPLPQGKICCQPTLPSLHRRRNGKNQEKNEAQGHIYRTSTYVKNVVNVAPRCDLAMLLFSNYNTTT